MKLFDHNLRSSSPRHTEVVRRYEIARTLVEFLAAVAFIIGSVLFFFPDWIYSGTWLFLVGSALFAVRPSIRLAMELRLVSLPVSDDAKAVGKS